MENLTEFRTYDIRIETINSLDFTANNTISQITNFNLPIISSFDALVTNENDMKQQQRLKCAFDADHLLNPGKVFPHLHRCAELGRLHVHKGKMPFPDLPRF